MKKNGSVLLSCMFFPNTVFEITEVILMHTDFKILSDINNRVLIQNNTKVPAELQARVITDSHSQK